MTLAPHEAHLAAWAIAALTAAGVIVRPFKWPEAVWAVSGALLLLVSGLLPIDNALQAVGKGCDVYLFLIGMMLLSETARREGLFDWVAAVAVNHSRSSPQRLFLLIYGVGVVVTTFMSNDATAVVLTPAVYAAARKAKVEPLPYLFICAFIANAASFVLPISNPANIVLYGDHTPPLGPWLARFAVPSLLSIVATYVALRCTEGRRLPVTCQSNVQVTPLSTGARSALAGLGLTAVALLVVSALDLQLGMPTAVMGVLTTAIVLVIARESPWETVKGVSWSVLPLVAGLFVLVEALAATGVIAQLARQLVAGVERSPDATAWISGGLVAVASNLVNNLPAGLVASSAVALAHPPQQVIDALLIGVDLGPNLSVTGSLATILWLTAIRREGENVGFWRFLKLGAIVMPPAFVLALGARLLFG
ncbi:MULTISPECIES: arsenic transporter [unclassified Variovorax]|uniref:arsenic transporter n=1 Tax=unclassified Variovorax TaxID=663243 RepID=UPI002B22CDFF|nr:MULTISPECIES: arsenic transporter [unclassified Variovorax]MEB0055882.1 arsenic transporter [Variovorax sp. LG9.2]MEB0113281.1 arsenic transporter [Variovorax sp. RTB1]